MFTHAILLCSMLVVGCAPSQAGPPQSPEGEQAPSRQGEPAIPTEPLGSTKPTKDPMGTGGGIDPSGQQGVRGSVTRLEGDFMPPTPPGYQGEVTPLLCRVFVFRGRLAPVAPDLNHPSLVKVVNTDKDGAFSASLEPGTYTVVPEIDGRLFLPSLDASGRWPSVDVVAGALTSSKIVIDVRTY